MRYTYKRKQENYSIPSASWWLAVATYESTVEIIPEKVIFDREGSFSGSSPYQFQYDTCYVPRAVFSDHLILKRRVHCLKSVEVYGPGSWKLIRTYKLAYHPSNITEGHTNILKSVESCDGQNVCLAPLQVRSNVGIVSGDYWEEANYPCEIGKVTSDDAGAISTGITRSSRRIFADLFGTGIPNLVLGMKVGSQGGNLTDAHFRVWQPNTPDIASPTLWAVVPNVYTPESADITGTQDVFGLKKGYTSHGNSKSVGESIIVGTYNDSFRPENFGDGYSGPNMFTLLYAARPSGSPFESGEDKLMIFNYAPDWNNNFDYGDDPKGYFAWYDTANIGTHQFVIFGCYISSEGAPGGAVKGHQGRIFIWQPRDHNSQNPQGTFGFIQRLTEIGCSNADQYLVVPDSDTGVVVILHAPMVDMVRVGGGEYHLSLLKPNDTRRRTYQWLDFRPTGSISSVPTVSLRSSSLTVSVLSRYHSFDCRDQYGYPVVSATSPATEKLLDVNGDGKLDIIRYQLAIGDDISIADSIRGGRTPMPQPKPAIVTFKAVLALSCILIWVTEIFWQVSLSILFLIPT